MRWNTPKIEITGCTCGWRTR